MGGLQNYFIGKYINSNDDVFERARAIMLYQFTVAFFILFLIPLISDIALGYEKAIWLHGFDGVMLIIFPFIIRGVAKLDHAIDLFFIIIFFTTSAATMMLIPGELNVIGVAWNFMFIALSALLQRGMARILYCCFFGWVPLFYVIINSHNNGALSWKWIVQEGAEEPPVFLMFVPIILCIYAIWSHTSTIQKARETITSQKTLLEEKNKDITDSIHYAKRIQESLLPTEKYIERNLIRLR